MEDFVEEIGSSRIDETRTVASGFGEESGLRQRMSRLELEDLVLAGEDAGETLRKVVQSLIIIISNKKSNSLIIKTIHCQLSYVCLLQSLVPLA